MSKFATGAVTGLLLVSAAQGAYRAPVEFRPEATSVVGVDTAMTKSPFTRVWTQLAGEIAVDRVHARHVNLSLNFPKMLRAFHEEDEPVVAYTTVSWGDELVRIVCVVDKSRSSLPLLRFRIVLRVTEGSLGTVPPGTAFAETLFRIFFEEGKLVMTSSFEFTPGILPQELPTNFTFSEHVLPDSWMTFRPGEVIVENIFTSVEPRGGGQPQVHQVVERFHVIDRAPRRKP